MIGCSVVLSFIYVLPITANNNKGRWFYEEQGKAIWEVPTKEKVIALTFDDGPSSKYTPQILDILKQYKAKATFFIVGSRVKAHPDIVKREILDGHELANHTYNHSNFRGLTEEEIRKELRKAKQTIVELTGFSPKLFRPPGGYYNETIINVANKEGYTVVMWSWHQDTYDWKEPGVSNIVKRFCLMLETVILSYFTITAGIAVKRSKRSSKFYLNLKKGDTNLLPYQNC
ncbi:polysaccharide deacetylase [Anoxybacillus vitaminiphilus]|uniref:Polysaccharide deacetylase n=1 Tax=Paranoxybacillus vitaminiphilus TaxID=581036 RepID=A0A327YB75_9BACL|nr:polysaccharide deacetylase [Anoxybacillus vitaminiphilus]